MSIKWHQSQFALHLQPFSNQGSSEVCASSRMCVVVMRVLCPWYGPESFVGALQHDSKLESYAQSIVLLLLSTSSFFFISRIS